ncbi:DUF2461 domain-containing protein [Pseudarthrobacter sp. MDT1-22]
MSTFQGIPAGAFAFYAELEPRFGPGKIFRPNRDIRFSQDKSPYKTAQGAFASSQEGVGYYVQVSADGLLVGGGCHTSTPAQLARLRNSVDASGTGESLRHIVETVAAAGFAVEGEKLKTVPRGFDKDHPRAELLKHKSLSAGIELGQPEWLDSPAAVQEIEALWDKLRPLVDWVGRHAAP